MLQCPCLYLACDGETSILIFKAQKRKYQSPRLSWNQWLAAAQMTGGASGKGHTCQCRRDERSWLNPWFRKIPWRRACNPLQHSCLENSMDRGARKAIVHRVAKSWKWLKWLNACTYTHTHTHTHTKERWQCSLYTHCFQYLLSLLHSSPDSKSRENASVFSFMLPVSTLTHLIPSVLYITDLCSLLIQEKKWPGLL